MRARLRGGPGRRNRLQSREESVPEKRRPSSEHAGKEVMGSRNEATSGKKKRKSGEDELVVVVADLWDGGQENTTIGGMERNLGQFRTSVQDRRLLIPSPIQAEGSRGEDHGRKNDSVKEKYPAPALSFFHIPIPEVRDLWFRGFVGQFQEAVAFSSVKSGILQSLSSMGDVKAVFIGHDHLNDFCGKINGIWFCYGGGFGYHGYGRVGWPRRARVISAQLAKGKKAWMGVETIRTWKRLDDDKLTKINEQLLWSNDYLPSGTLYV
ncbi:hypothetical protein GW17_00042610 [Ensete ventricosum]|nr:hypothetical protein GW17_00042610 [Ensete ventricosum]